MKTTVAFGFVLIVLLFVVTPIVADLGARATLEPLIVTLGGDA
jgi:hypothetical protein